MKNGGTMKKKNWRIIGVVVILLIISGYSIQKLTDETYQGMSIIPEEHIDIPLFDGLEPTEHQYIMKDDHWRNIFYFYMEELPYLGWELAHVESALDDKHAENDWSGFRTRWRKDGFEGELWISAQYNETENQTEVMFDKTDIIHSTNWIHSAPESICIYQSAANQNCTKITDKSVIEQISSSINEAMDWNKEVESRKNTLVIEYADIKINVLYEGDKGMYLQSEKGIKLMKPEQEFLDLLILK